MPKGWEKEFWVDILRYCDGKITLEEIENKYKDNVIVAQLSITSPRILKRFDKFNSNNTKNRIKPFNFINVGIGYRRDNASNNAIIPAIPFTKDTKTVKYMPFVDYKTGKYYENNTQYYWKPLSDMFLDYINHKESKYDGDIGTLQSKHINIIDVEYVGKESNNLEESQVRGAQKEDYVYYRKDTADKVLDKIKTLTIEEARKRHISDWQFYYLRKKPAQDQVPKLKKKTLRLLGL